MFKKLKKKLKRKMNEIGSNDTNKRVYIRKLFNAYWLLHYKFDTFYIRPDEKTVIFASFEGRSYSDSPKALFEYMVTSREFEDYTFIWGFRKKVPSYRKRLNVILDKLYPGYEDEHENRPGPELHIVKYNGKTWRKYLAKSKWWVFNYKIPDYLKPKPDQIFLQTWHGTPLKRLGFDLEHFDSATNTEEGIKKRYAKEIQKFTYFLTTCPFATEKFISAWRMDYFGKTNIIMEEGYPRDDILVNYTEEQVLRLKDEIFGYWFLPYQEMIPKKKKIILYAPTYRPNEYEVGKGHLFNETIDFDDMRDVLGDDYIVLFRAHYFIASKFDFSKYGGFVYNVSNWDDINDLYLISDILITDYSSSMFDFSILKRPMVFYMYDLEHYRDESNGFYFDPEEELPGPVIKTESELFAAIKEAGENFEYDEKYRRFNEKFNPYDDGHNCERIINKVFKGA